jgi:hypothetical protein
MAVTAEVASSSLVVPAIPNQALTPVEEFSRGHKKVQIPREASSFAHNSAITMLTFNAGLGGLIASLRALDRFYSPFPTISETTAVWAVRLAAVTAWV